MPKKVNFGMNTEYLAKFSQQCQATFPSVRLSNFHGNNTVGLSPIREESSPNQVKETIAAQNNLKKKLEDSEKENINLMNTIEDWRVK